MLASYDMNSYQSRHFARRIATDDLEVGVTVCTGPFLPRLLRMQVQCSCCEVCTLNEANPAHETLKHSGKVQVKFRTLTSVVDTEKQTS